MADYAGNNSGAPENASHDMLSAAEAIPDDMVGFDDEGDQQAGQQREMEEREPSPREATAEPPREPRQPPQEAEDGEGGGDEPASPDDGSDAAPKAEDEHAEARRQAAEDAKTIKIDGKDVPIAEIRQGYLRQQDYTRKTQEIAQTRQRLEAQVQRVQAGEAELGKVLDLAVQVVQRAMPQKPDVAMIQTDPIAYMQQQAAYEAAMTEIGQIQRAQSQVGQRTQQESAERQRQSQEQFQQALATETEAMRTKLPELFEPKGREQFMRDAAEYGDRVGLKESDILGIQDHRALLVLKDAIAYRKLLAAKPAAVERAKTAPPIPPTARPVQGNRSQVARGAIERLRREGTIEAGVAALPDSWFT